MFRAPLDDEAPMAELGLDAVAVRRNVEDRAFVTAAQIVVVAVAGRRLVVELETVRIESIVWPGRR